MSEINLSHVWPEWKLDPTPLGKGSYGTVYKAVRQDSRLTSYAAIKIISIPQDPAELDSLRSEGLNAEETMTYLQGIVDNFVNEIQLMQSFKGTQNIVSIEDYRVMKKARDIGWTIYIRMELLTPLMQHTAENKMTETDVIRLGCDICSALEMCSQRNIIHRDIKPDNIFINDFGSFKLGDFGIARTLSSMTSGMSQKGTPFYMAPEVFTTNQYDSRVDICSLGLVMYRLLNNDLLPFISNKKQLLDPNERDKALERRRTGEPLPPPSDASPAMANLILKACAPNPVDRFANAAEMKAALMSITNGTYVMDSLRTTPLPKSMQKAAASAGSTGNGGSSFTAKKRKIPFVPIFLAALLAAGVFLGYPHVKDIIQKDPLTEDSMSDQLETNSGSPDTETAEETESAADAEINTILTKAVSLAAGTDYAGAVELIRTGLTSYPSSEILQEKLTEYQFLLDDQNKQNLLSEADALAAANDYAGAVAKLMEGLTVYPDFAILQEKLTEYQTFLDNQSKQKILDDAAALASAGDYTGALAVIDAALTNSPNEEVYLNARKQHLLSYETAVLAQARNLADNQQYQDAINVIDAALQIVTEQTALKTAREDYLLKQQNQLLQNSLTTAATQAASGDYMGALVTLNQAIQQFGENDALTAAVSEYQAAYAQSLALQNSSDPSAPPAAAVTNPNQNAVQPTKGKDVNVTCSTTFDGAVEVNREDINHCSFDTEKTSAFYKVTTSSNYSAYRFALLNNSVDTSVYITVYDEYQQKLGSSSSSKGKHSYVDLVLDPNTTYWIQFHRYYDNKMGNYQFVVSEHIQDSGTNMATAFTVLTDEKYTKEMSVSYFTEWFTFTTGSNYSVYRLEGKNNNIDTSVYFTLYDEYETELGNVSISKGKTGYLDAALENNRQYYVKMSRYYDDRLGNYQFTIHEKVCDAGLKLESAFPVTLNMVQHGVLDTTFNDWYVFTAPEAGEYTFSLTNNNIDSTTYLHLYDYLGTQLHKEGISASKKHSVTFNMEKGASAYIYISRYYNDRLGNYTLQVTK